MGFLFFSSHNTTSPNTASVSKRSSRSRDPEFAAKQKAFLAKVVTATNGSMDNFLAEQNMEVSEQVNSAGATGPVPTVIPLKRKLDRSAFVKHTGLRLRISPRMKNTGG